MRRFTRTRSFAGWFVKFSYFGTRMTTFGPIGDRQWPLAFRWSLRDPPTVASDAASFRFHFSAVPNQSRVIVSGVRRGPFHMLASRHRADTTTARTARQASPRVHDGRLRRDRSKHLGAEVNAVDVVAGCEA